MKVVRKAIKTKDYRQIVNHFKLHEKLTLENYAMMIYYIDSADAQIIKLFKKYYKRNEQEFIKKL